MRNLYPTLRCLLVSITFLISIVALGQQSVSIGTTEIKSNAVLYLLGSGSQGLIIPVTTNPSSITPTAGMVVYNSGDQKVYYCDGTTWAPISGGVNGTDSQTLTITGNSISISNGNSQNIAGTAPTTVGQILVWDGTKWTSSGGANTPSINQILQWNGTTWVPTTLASGGTVTSVATGTGLTGGPVTTTGTIALANTAVTAGSYGTSTSVPQIAVDAQGRITSATNVSIPTANNLNAGLLSNTDWTTFNGKMTNPMTTAGDLVYGGASGTPTRLATGTGFLKGGATPSYSAVNLASGDITGTLPLTNGGTGATTAAAARTNLGLGTLSTLSTITTAEITDGTITATDLNTMSATNGQVLKFNGTAWVPSSDDVGAGATPTLSNGQILVGNGTTNSAAALSGDATLSAGVLTIGNGAITSAKILDGTIAAADFSSMSATNGQVLQYNGSTWIPTTLSGSGDMLKSVYDVNNDNIVDVAASVNLGSQTANTILAAPNGSAGTPTFRALVANDLPNIDVSKLSTGVLGVARGGTGIGTTPTNGQLLIGNGTGYTVASLTAGSGISITPGAGSISIASTTSGTVTSVGAGTGLTGGPITTSGTLAVNVGTGANQIPQLDGTGKLNTLVIPTAVDVNASDDITTSSSAGGDLTGTYPNPTITTGAVTSAKILDGTIVAADLNDMSATNGQVLKYNGSAWVPSSDDVGGGATPTLANGQILIGNGTTNSAAALSGDATLSAGILTIGTGAITSGKILDGTIAAADLNAMGASNGQVLQYNAGAWSPTTLAAGGSVTSVATGTGLTGGPVTTTGTISLANTAVTPNTYGTSTSVAQFTVDAQGRLTAASSIAIPTANTTTTGLLTSADWNTFNGKATNPMTAVGDIIYGGASGTPTRLATGTGFLKGGATPTYSAINLASTDVTGTLPLANGGTNATTAAGARTSLGLGTLSTLSAVTSTEITDGTIAAADLNAMGASNGQVLQYNSGVWSPTTLGSGGTVTSVATGTGLTGGPVTTTGTISLANTAVTLGTYGTSTSVAQFTVDAQGRLTAASSIAIPTANTITTGLLTNADWNTFNGKATNPMTTAGDIIYGGASGTPTRLGQGTGFLKGGATPAYSAINLASTDVTGTLPLANGGTNATTAAGARTSLGLGTLSTLSAVTSTEITDATITAADLAVGAVDLTTTDVTGILPIALGGTNSSATPTNGGVGYGTGTAHAYTAAGTTGQLLQSNGAAAPTWINAPATVTASNGLTKTVNDIALGGTLTTATSIAMGTNNLTFTGTGNLNFQAGSIGIGIAPLNKLHVFQNVSGVNPMIVFENGNGTGDGSLRLSGGATHYTIGSDASANAFVISNNSTGLGTNDRFAINSAGNVGIGVITPASKLDVEGGVAIGASYSGTTASPSNGLIVEGNVGVGTSAPSTNKIYVNIPSTDATNPVGVRIDNNYTGASTKYGIDVNVDGAGSGPKYGISSSVIGLVGDASANYGYQVAMTPNGTGSVYGIYSNISSASTGERIGFRNYVYGNSANTSPIYGSYNLVNHTGSGDSYLFYGTNSGAGAGTEYGLYIENEDYNYFSGKVGIATTSTTRALNVGGDIDATGGIYFGSIEAFTDGGSNQIAANAAIRPTADNNSFYTLGTSSFRWSAVWAADGTINTSDFRLKDNIKNLNYGLTEVMKLRPVSYTWKSGSSGVKLGLIAQETETIIPEVVRRPEEEGGYYGLMYSDLVPVTIKAIQEQQALIAKQQSEIEALKAKLAELDLFKAELQKLKEIVGAEAKKPSKQ